MLEDKLVLRLAEQIIAAHKVFEELVNQLPRLIEGNESRGLMVSDKLDEYIESYGFTFLEQVARESVCETIVKARSEAGVKCQCTHEAGDSPCQLHDVYYDLGVYEL